MSNDRLKFKTLDELVEELCEARAVDEQSKAKLTDCVNEIKRIIDNYMCTSAELNGAAKALRAINVEAGIANETSAEFMRNVTRAIKCLSDFVLKIQTGEALERAGRLKCVP